MSKFNDRALQCADCNRTFTFTAGEQEFYTERGYSEPRRCPDCRAARKTSRAGGDRPAERRSSPSRGYGDSGGGERSGYGDRAPRQMFDIVCAECGQKSQVPFRPRNDRPVYCKDCYEKLQQR
jgi:CxxC-x17-CxxC domain-containing protein